MVKYSYILWYSVEYNRPMYKSLESCDGVCPTVHFSSTTSNAAWTRYCSSSSLSKSDVAMYCGEFWKLKYKTHIRSAIVNTMREKEKKIESNYQSKMEMEIDKLTSLPMIAMHTAIIQIDFGCGKTRNKQTNLFRSTPLAANRHVNTASKFICYRHFDTYATDSACTHNCQRAPAVNCQCQTLRRIQ